METENGHRERAENYTQLVTTSPSGKNGRQEAVARPVCAWTLSAENQIPCRKEPEVCSPKIARAAQMDLPSPRKKKCS